MRLAHIAWMKAGVVHKMNIYIIKVLYNNNNKNTQKYGIFRFLCVSRISCLHSEISLARPKYAFDVHMYVYIIFIFIWSATTMAFIVNQPLIDLFHFVLVHRESDHDCVKIIEYRMEIGRKSKRVHRCRHASDGRLGD